MTRFGITTFHDADNYGALLQAFALQTTLERMGHSAEFLSMAERPDTAVAPLESPILATMRKARHGRFQAFRAKYLHISECPVEEADQKFDAFISGSDQVWNYGITGLTDGFYLPFASKGKRFSYAASFGRTELDAKVKPYIAQWLQEMDGISVRDEASQRIAQELVGTARDVSVLPDPTLLLTPDDYRSRLTIAAGDPSVVVYMISYDAELLARARGYAAERGLPVKLYSASFLEKLGRDAIPAFTTHSPDSLVADIANSAAVFANSFHAAVFAMIFHKPHVIIPLQGALSARNARFETLFDSLGVKGEELNGCDWDAVDKRMAVLRQAGREFLRGIAEAAPGNTGIRTERSTAMLPDFQNCFGCEACVAVCQVKAIKMTPGAGGFLVPEVDRGHCVECGRCREVCPALAKQTTDVEVTRCFVGRLADVKMRDDSTSGGVFQQLARVALRAGNAVVGVAFDSKMMPQHTMIRTEQELAPLLKSKYVQSRKGTIYNDVLNELRNGGKVLFSGTPCEVAAMARLAEAEKVRDQMLLVDFVCSGVPAPDAWKGYLEALERTYGGRPAWFDFRNKANHDDGHTVAFEINGVRHEERFYDNSYCRLFSRGILHRPSCNHCPFTGIPRRSDITLGDAWGIERLQPNYDHNGLSLVVAHTPKGLKVLAEATLDLTEVTQTQDAPVPPALMQPRLVSPKAENIQQKTAREILPGDFEMEAFFR